MNRERPLVALSLLAAGCLLGCQGNPFQAQNVADAAVAGPPARVDLPAPVPLEGSMPPETDGDGKMRIDGLLARREKYFGQKILVRGYLVEKSDCPKEATHCVLPHGYLADTPAGGDKKLLLVNLSDEILDALKVGESYVVTGTFDRTSNGFVSSTGLLAYDSIEGLVIPPTKGHKR
jgi:hypothetical protein